MIRALQEEERRLKRDRKKVQQFRLRMKAGKDQPSMMEMVMVCKVVPGDCVSRIGVSLEEVGCKNLKPWGPSNLKNYDDRIREQ